MFGSSAPFGSSSGGFGQQNTTPAFGSPAPAPFGGSFGAPAPAPFGSPAPAPSGFGGFGAPAPTPGFGGGSTFGTPAPAPSAFGSSGGFGSSVSTSSPFGAPTPAPSGGLFGSPPAPAGGLFGAAPAPAPGSFGATNTGFGGFGSTPAPAPAFGGGSTFGTPAPAPSTGLFGAPAPAPGGFGSTGFGSTASSFGTPAPAGGMFGAPAPAPGGMFGSSAPGGGGTKITPFAVTTRQDGSTAINLQSISAMSQYEQKSFEELRFEDYSQGNRGTGTSAGSSGGGFGGFGSPAPAPSGGMFGAAAPAPSTFGGPAPAPGGFGGFGAPAPAPGGFGGSFGAPAPSAFGAPAPAPAPFGAPAPAPGAFGTFGAPAAAPSTGLFGAPAPVPGGIFGSTPAPAPGGLFAPTPAPAFGTPAPAPGGLFGAPAPAPPGGLFGSTPAPAPAFGAAPAPFGAPALGGFGTFGSPAPAPSGGLFGAPAPAPAFGAPNPSGGLFGAPAPAPAGGFFGAPAPAFGAPAPSGGLFGAPAPSGFLGGAAPTAQYMPTAPAVGSVMPPATNEILAAQLTALENKRKEIEKSDNFRGKPSESSSINGMTLSEKEGLSSLTPVRASYSSYRPSPRSNAKIRPRGFASPEKTTAPLLSRLGSGGKPMVAPDSLAASSVTRLVINPSPKPKMKLLLNASTPAKGSPLKLNGQNITSPTDKISFTRISEQSSASLEVKSTSSAGKSGSDCQPGNGGASLDYYKKVLGSPDEAAGVASQSKKTTTPKLTKTGYSCIPSIKELQSMPPEDLAAVPNFSVVRPGVGIIEWEGAVDVRGADLDTLVVIEDDPHSASVYTKEEDEGTKPSVGTKLNRPAIITLENVFPPKNTSSEKFKRKVEKSTKRNHAELIKYNASTGDWSFRVLHFSRYALTDDDSESEAENEQNFESGGREGRSRATGRILKERKGTPLMPKTAIVSLEEEAYKKGEIAYNVDVKEGSKVFADAESAFESMQVEIESNKVPKSKGTGNFSEEIKASKEKRILNRFCPNDNDFRVASMRGGICFNIAREAGLKTSSIDFGFRMGKSFRAGWGPDGSILCLQSGGILERRKPLFSADNNDQTELLGKLQENSCDITTAGQSCPRLSLPTARSDKNKLLKSLNAFATSDESAGDSCRVSIANQAFSLLECLLKCRDYCSKDQFAPLSGDQTSDEKILEGERLHAITLWLVSSCSREVDSEIKSSRSRNNKYAALLSAVSGGDIEKSCFVAQDLGFVHLSTLLASGPVARSDVLSQVVQWTDSRTTQRIPDELIRTYFLIGGNSKMEEDIYRKKYSSFDWRRRLAMRLVYETSAADTNLTSLIQEYEAKLRRGVAPFPQPHYLSSDSEENIQCVLYKLLRFGINELEVSLREIIDPASHTRFVHDFSLSFHLAAATSALCCSCPLTDVEEQNLVDGYAAQLISQGHWEWAVYVSLFVLDSSETSYASWKAKKAKSLVIQNFTGALSRAEECRQFLEDVGVPSAWFEEALALRDATNGDSYGFLNHMVNVSTKEICKTLEQVLIPNMIFMNKEKLDESLKLLEVFAVDKNSLAYAVYTFFQVYQSILTLEGASSTEIEGTMPALLEACDSIEQVFVAYKSGEDRQQGKAIRFVPALVPLSSFLAEALSQLSLFKLQMKALQAGISISSTASQILNLSTPEREEFKESSMSARENICRWLM